MTLNKKPILSVNNLQVEFPTRKGNLVAVNDISFEVNEGEVLGVVGESGAGKSITGSSIIGLIDPPGRITGGQINFLDQRIDHLSAEEMRTIRGKEIGMVFQDPLTSLNPLYRIGRQLTETIQTHLHLDEKNARLQAFNLLAEVGIPSPEIRIDHYPHQFSGGMRQRVVISLALCCEPELLIADEPTTALDVSIQSQILDLIKRLTKERNLAVILITHDMGVISETTNRVAVMKNGDLVEIGPTKEILTKPKEIYTKALVSSVPPTNKKINRFKIIVEKYNDSIFIEEALHRLVEVYYKIGLEEEAKQAAAILGYNYQSGEWYERSYKVFNKKKRKKIVGPEDWKNPNTGEVIKVYKRTRKSQSGVKTQLFTVTNDGQCIGRVWDSRRGGRVIKNGCKFPLGVWKEGETRTFLGSSGGKPRKIELKILKLGKKQKDSVKFNWKLYDGSGKLMDNNDYTFSPGKAMSALKDKKF